MTGQESGRAEPLVRGVFIANLVAQTLIVVTGAVVRLTGSGLGCPTWPECVEGSVTPTSEQVQSWHKYVEFGNRLLTFALVLLAIAAIIAAFYDARQRRAHAEPRRPVLLLLALIPLLGTVAQAALGGVTVLTGLNPATVASHFLVSMAIIAGCVALVVRAGDAGDSPVRLLVTRSVRWLVWGVVAITAAIVMVGVLVTGSGPHSGDVGAQARFDFDPRVVAWLHADIALAFIGLTVGLLVALLAISGPRQARRIVLLMLTVAAVQIAVGYSQYFTGLPIVLVTIHVSLACGLWLLVLFLPSTIRIRGGVDPRDAA